MVFDGMDAQMQSDFLQIPSNKIIFINSVSFCLQPQQVGQ